MIVIAVTLMWTCPFNCTVFVPAAGYGDTSVLTASGHVNSSVELNDVHVDTAPLDLAPCSSGRGAGCGGREHVKQTPLYG